MEEMKNMRKRKRPYKYSTLLRGTFRGRKCFMKLVDNNNNVDDDDEKWFSSQGRVDNEIAAYKHLRVVTALIFIPHVYTHM